MSKVGKNDKINLQSIILLLDIIRRDEYKGGSKGEMDRATPLEIFVLLINIICSENESLICVITKANGPSSKFL